MTASIMNRLQTSQSIPETVRPMVAPAVVSHFPSNGSMRASRIAHRSSEDESKRVNMAGVTGISLDVINSMHESAQSNTVQSETSSPSTQGDSSPIVRHDHNIVPSINNRENSLGSAANSEDGTSSLSPSFSGSNMPFAVPPAEGSQLPTSFNTQMIRPFPAISDNSAGLSLLNPSSKSEREKNSSVQGNYLVHDGVHPPQRVAHPSANNVSGGGYRGTSSMPSSFLAAQQQHRRPPLSPTPRIEMSYINSQHGVPVVGSPLGRAFTYGSQNLLDSSVSIATPNRSRFFNDSSGRLVGAGSGRFISSNSDVNLSSAMISMMRGDNMEDYKNDFYWLAQYQRERAKNPKVFEELLNQSQEEGAYYSGEGGDNDGAFAMSSSSFPYTDQNQQQQSFWNDNPLALSGPGGFVLNDLHGDRTAARLACAPLAPEYKDESQRFHQHMQVHRSDIRNDAYSIEKAASNISGSTDHIQHNEHLITNVEESKILRRVQADASESTSAQV
jgi:hypothetical protein